MGLRVEGLAAVHHEGERPVIEELGDAEACLLQHLPPRAFLGRLARLRDLPPGAFHFPTLMPLLAFFRRSLLPRMTWQIVASMTKLAASALLGARYLRYGASSLLRQGPAIRQNY